MKNKIISRIRYYTQLIKLRLSLLVVFSSAMSYLWAVHRSVDPITIWMLSIGGFLVTGSSNILNQIYERKSDFLMKRTQNRPLPSGKMRISEALILAVVTGLCGLVILYKINYICFFLSLAAMIIYVGIYTPMKKISWLAVIPGAAAGSLPVVAGWAAATGVAGKEAWLLFLIQFLWQFPHTWSIAWLLNDDYKNAGIKLLPLNVQNKTSAFIILLSTFLIVPAGFVLHSYGYIHLVSALLFSVAGITLSIYALHLYRQRSVKAALRLMLICIAYLPAILIILVTEKLL